MARRASEDADVSIAPSKIPYGGFSPVRFKAACDSPFLNGVSVKPAPGIPSPLSSLPPPFARVPLKGRPGSESRSIQASTCRCTGGFPPYPRGPSSGLSYGLDPSPPNPTSCASPAGTSRLRFYTYTQRLRGAGAPRRPAGPSLLSLAVLSCMLSTLPRWPTVSSRCPRTAFPGFRISNESPPANTRLCQQFSTGHFFRGCIVLFMLRPAGLPSPPDWLRQDEATCTSPCLLRYIVTPAFGAVRHRTALGVRLDG